MKSSPLLPVILGATAVVAIALAFWQAQTIHQLRAEQAALRQDLRSALATGMDKVPQTAGEQANRDRLELIKLRNESRELRESLAEARAAQPTGLKGLIRPLLPPPSATQLQPEWKGMEQLATNQYDQAMRAVNNGTNELVRFLSLPKAAKLSLAMGRTEDARKFAEDALTLNEKFSRGSPEKANGDAVHDGNMVLGRIASGEGRMDDAKRHLLAAGRTKGSPVLDSFGPNMGLAKDLLEHGEQATVLEYFELCRNFWTLHGDRLDVWKKDVENGRIPDFGANLLH